MKIKFCGFRTLEDVEKAKALNIDAMGFIHFTESKRFVDIQTIKQFTDIIPNDKEKVIILVNPERATIDSIINHTGITTIQLHGNEPISTVQYIRQQNSNLKIIKALPAVNQQTLLTSIDYYKHSVDQFIIDTPSQSYGGTGKTYDWKILDTIHDVDYLIAGGINYENIQKIENLSLHHTGYDIASGIETNHKKDLNKMLEIIKLLKGAQSTMIENIQTEADAFGFFGNYGGQYVPETLMPAIQELKQAYQDAKNDPQFQIELDDYLKDYVGRETPLTYAKSYSELLGGAKIYLKREDLNHTGAHKINNALGQALLAKRMGKNKLVAETGAGQHGVASATVAALFDMELVVFMGEEDIKRQSLNVFRMELLGAKVESVTEGQGTLSDAVNKALQYWVSHVDDTHYLLGSALGPDPFPTIVRDFQKIIGQEIKAQVHEKEGQLPDAIVACVGGGSNAIGTFYPFVKDDVKLYGVEAAGDGIDSDKHALAINKGREGVLHGTKMYLIQDDDGQIQLAHSISAGLDYPGVGPEHSYYHDIGRVKYATASDKQAMDALVRFTKAEGIIPAIESAHALSYVETLAPTMRKDEILVVTVSGRGDKDMETIRNYMKQEGDTHA